MMMTMMMMMINHLIQNDKELVDNIGAVAEVVHITCSLSIVDCSDRI